MRLYNQNRRATMAMIAGAMRLQRMEGRPHLILKTTPFTNNEQPEILNKNLRPERRPMDENDKMAVRKLTGFAPFLEVKYV